MKSETIVVLIVVTVIVLAAAGITAGWLLHRANERKRIDSLPPEERAAHEAARARETRLKEAQRELSAATKEHAALVRGAEKDLSRGQAGHQKAVATAQRALADARAIGTRDIGTYSGKEGRVSATETTVTVPQGTFPIDLVTAAVNTAGNFSTSNRTTLTRVAAGGLLFGPVGAIVGASAKKNTTHDLRELYLMVEGPGFATVLTCNPDHGPRVRQFAATLTAAARNKEAVLAHRAYEVPAAQRRLEATIADISAIQRLEAQLESARGQVARVRAAEARVAEESAPV